MSEYQYYEFQAIDRPLTNKEMDALRSYSTRARITPTSFVNEYSFGSFKGNADRWMEQYFDAFLYVANWGSHVLKLRLPAKLLPRSVVRPYCGGNSICAKENDGRVVLTFDSEEEDGGDWEEGEGWLSSLIPIRAELARGDLRALYIGWLLHAQSQELDDGDMEPPVPSNLGGLSASLRSLVDFLRIDADLLAVATENSATAPENPVDRVTASAWLSGLTPAAKDEILTRLMLHGEGQLQNELLARFNQEHRHAGTGNSEQHAARRTVGELLAAGERRAEARRQAEAKKAAEKQARHEREAALAREKYLDALASREDKIWNDLDRLIAMKQPQKYDQAVQLLIDLRDSAVRKHTEAGFGSKLDNLRATHAQKPSFLKRLKDAGL
jgi:hypothetical protein